MGKSFFNMPPASTYKYKKGSRWDAKEFLQSSATFWGSTVQRLDLPSNRFHRKILHLCEPLPNGIAITWFFPQKTSPRTLPKEIHNPIACCLKDLRPVGLNEIVKIVFGESLKEGICKNQLLGNQDALKEEELQNRCPLQELTALYLRGDGFGGEHLCRAVDGSSANQLYIYIYRILKRLSCPLMFIAFTLSNGAGTFHPKLFP